MPFDFEAVTPKAEDITSVYGMIVSRERQLLHYLASKVYTGVGEIVELGCFVGCSTSCLAKGLEANTRVANKTKRINTFDWFQFFDEMPWSGWLESQGVKKHQRLINLFLDFTRPWQDMINVQPGDIISQTWDGRPIEILFIDCGRNWRHNDHIVEQFYSALIPGHSYIVHQDYIYWHNHWVSVTMEWMSDYFEVADCTATTVTFKLVKPIPREHLQKRVSSLSDAAKLVLMQRAVDRSEGIARPVMLMAKANLTAELKGWEAAREQVEAIARDHGDNPKVKDWIGELPMWQAREEKGGGFPDYAIPAPRPAMGKITWRG